MSEKEKNESEKVSRRKFLRDAGFIVGGAAALGIGGLALTGCGTDRPCPTVSASTQAKVEYFGECVCPNCDTKIPHPRGVPCRMINCPNCGEGMARGAI
jgi:hypothetical protein